jgi:hypothetical protein
MRWIHWVLRPLVIVVWMACANAPIAATDALDPSSPRGVAAAFGNAIKTHDIATAKSLTTGSPIDQRIIDTFAAASAARTKLHEAAQKKFGKDELTTTPPSPGRGPVGAERLSDMSQWEETIDGDTATLSMKNDGVPTPAGPPFNPDQPATAKPAELHLKKIDGKWKLDITTMVPPEKAELYFAVLDVTSRVSDLVADDIMADRYANSADARASYKQRMMAAVRPLMTAGGRRPATAPIAPQK